MPVLFTGRLVISSKKTLLKKVFPTAIHQAGFNIMTRNAQTPDLFGYTVTCMFQRIFHQSGTCKSVRYARASATA